MGARVAKGVGIVIVGIGVAGAALGEPRERAKPTPIKLMTPERTSPTCPRGMIEVRGEYCPIAAQPCRRWLDPPAALPRRCAEFAPTGPCRARPSVKHYCIDRYEYPNEKGVVPTVMKTFREAEQICRDRGKRLCTGSEWTLACEGRERFAYPTGPTRDAQACNIDRRLPKPDARALAHRETRSAEIARLWQGEASGARSGCRSPFGVYDMTGNVDEWVVNESGYPHRSGLKGGYWGPVRDSCRPMTTAHDETFSFYQIGFRCCADPLPLAHEDVTTM